MNIKHEPASWRDVEAAITRAASALDKASSTDARAILKEQITSLYAVAGRSVPHELETLNASTPCTNTGTWIELMKLFINDVKEGRYTFPYQVINKGEDEPLIAFLPSHVIMHLKMSGKHRTILQQMKSHRLFKRELQEAGTVVSEEISYTSDDGRRQTHAIGVSIERLREFDIDV